MPLGNIVNTEPHQEQQQSAPQFNMADFNTMQDMFKTNQLSAANMFQQPQEQFGKENTATEKPTESNGEVSFFWCLQSLLRQRAS